MLKKQFTMLLMLALAFPLASAVLAQKWVSQYHGEKKVNNIEATDVKEEDYVICTGTFDKSGTLHATLISTRLSHSH